MARWLLRSSVRVGVIGPVLQQLQLIWIILHYNLCITHEKGFDNRYHRAGWGLSG